MGVSLFVVGVGFELGLAFSGGQPLVGLSLQWGEHFVVASY